MTTLTPTEHRSLSPDRISSEALSLPNAYWALSPELVPRCSAPLLSFLSQLAEHFGSTSTPDGATSMTVTYSNRDASAAIAQRTGIADRTVDDRLSELRKLPGVRLVYAETRDRLTITLPPIEGTRRPQVPKGVNLSGRALRVWLALQLAPRTASVSKLAELLGCSANTVRAGERELVSAGLVARARVSAPGKAHNRALPGLIRSNPQRKPTPSKSCAGPLQNPAPFRLSKQSYKGRSSSGSRFTVAERSPGHTRESSTFDKWELLDESELEQVSPPPMPTLSTSMSAGDRIAEIRKLNKLKAQR